MSADDIRDRLQKELMKGLWSDLRPHAEREALFLVAQDLDLIAVGSSIVSDDTKALGQWIQQGLITRPSKEQVQAWDQAPDKSFHFLITQPYVLAQELGH